MPVSVGNELSTSSQPFGYGQVKMIPGCQQIKKLLEQIEATLYPTMLQEHYNLQDFIAKKFSEELAIKGDAKILIVSEASAEIPIFISSEVTYSPEIVAQCEVILYSDFLEESQKIRDFIAKIYSEHGVRVSKVLATMIAAPLINDDFGAKVYALVEV